MFSFRAAAVNISRWPKKTTPSCTKGEDLRGDTINSLHLSNVLRTGMQCKRLCSKEASPTGAGVTPTRLSQ